MCDDRMDNGKKKTAWKHIGMSVCSGFVLVKPEQQIAIAA